MDRKSKIIIIGTLLVSILSIGLCVFKYFVQQDYSMRVAASCDPSAQPCFVWVCNPEEEECEEGDADYYTIYQKFANDFPVCRSNEEGSCKEMTCGIGDDCMEIVCDEITSQEEGSECSDPVEFQEIELTEEESSQEQQIEDQDVEGSNESVVSTEDTLE